MKAVTTSILALAAATPALAQTDPNPPATDAAGDAIVVTASRSGDAIPADLLGSSVNVLDAADLVDRGTRIVSDVLRDVPGVAVSRTGAIGGLTQVRLRGAEADQTLVLIDGIEASDPYSGEFDFGTLIADPEARIEVLRGQQSALYGSDAIGGVISYTTLTGREAPGVTLRAEGGSLGTVDGAARVAGVSGALDYAASGSWLHTSGYPVAPSGLRDVGSDNRAATAKATWTAAPNLKLTAVGRYTRTRADTDDTDQTFGSPTYGGTVDSPGVHFVNRGLYGLVRGQLDLLDGRWTNVLSGQVADTERTGTDVVDPYSPIAGQEVVTSSGDHGRRVKGSFESTIRFGSGDVEHRVTAAIDLERESERTTISTYGAFLGWRHKTDVGVVGEYQLTVGDRFGFGASVRHDENNRFADPTTYRIQASYRLGEGTRLHAAAGSGVKDPTFSDLYDYFAGRYIGNPNLRPEKSHGWEAGIGQSLLDGRIALDATYFDSRLKDEIGTDYSTGVASPINLPGSRPQRGLELTAAAKLGAGVRIDATYTYLHAPQDRDVLLDGANVTFDGQAVRRAKNIASANLSYAPEDKPYDATVTVRYNGRQYDNAYTDPSFVPVLTRLHAFTLVDVNAGYRITPKIELFARIENLLDRHYQEVFSYQAQGRGVYGGVRVRL